MDEPGKLLLLAWTLTTLTVSPAGAQSSASYEISDHTLNAGGHPVNGLVMTSGDAVGHRMTLDAIGDGVVAIGLHADSHAMDIGFGATYAPPGEVANLRFLDHDFMQWDPEKSGGPYNVYRQLISNLASLGYGECFDPSVTATTDTDSGIPPSGDGYFYLVTARNRLGEEGTKGRQSSGSERQGTTCP